MPVYYTYKTRIFLLRFCLICIFGWVLVMLFKLILYDWQIVDRESKSMFLLRLRKKCI